MTKLDEAYEKIFHGGIRIGAPGSVARYVQEALENNPDAFGENHWGVFEYTSRGPVMRAGQATRKGAEKYMKPGRVLINFESYRR